MNCSQVLQQVGEDIFKLIFSEFPPDLQSEVLWDLARLQPQHHPLFESVDAFLDYLDGLKSLWKIRPQHPDFKFEISPIMAYYSGGSDTINWYLKLSLYDLEQCMKYRVNGFGEDCFRCPPLVDNWKAVAEKENQICYELSVANKCSFFAFCNAADLFSLSAMDRHKSHEYVQKYILTEKRSSWPGSWVGYQAYIVIGYVSAGPNLMQACSDSVLTLCV
jgi:hypothetical protein